MGKGGWVGWVGLGSGAAVPLVEKWCVTHMTINEREAFFVSVVVQSGQTANYSSH